jgi:hypothetical protein
MLTIHQHTRICLSVELVSIEEEEEEEQQQQQQIIDIFFQIRIHENVFVDMFTCCLPQ